MVLGWLARAQNIYEGGFEGAEGWIAEFEENLKTLNPSFLFSFHEDFCAARESALRRREGS